MDRVTLTEFVGAPSAVAWSRVEELRVSEEGRIYIAFTVTGVDAGPIGREVVAHLRAEKPSSFEGWYELLVNLNALVVERGGKLAFASGFIGFAESGWISSNGIVSLRRDDKFGTVISGPGLSVKSGRILEDDLYVLTTAGGTGLADEVRALKERGFKLDGIVSTLGRLLPTHPQADQTAVCLLHVVPESSILDVGSKSAGEQILASAAATEVSSVLVEEKPVDQVSFKPRRLDLDEQAQIKLPVGDRKLSLGDRFKIIGTVVGPVIKKSGAGLLRGIQNVGSWSLSLVNASLQRFGKRGALTHALPSDVAPPLRPSLSTKKVVAMITVGVGLLILLSLLITGFIMWRRGLEDQAAAFVQPYNTRYDQATQLARLDPIRGRDQLETLIEELRTAQAESKQGSQQREAIETTLAKAEVKLAELVGSEALASVPVWLDLQDQAPGFVANTVSSKPGWLVVADTAQQKAFSIDLRQKIPTLIDLSQVPTARAIELRSPEELLTLGEGIHSVAIPGGESVKLVDASDSNRAGNLISSFDDFIYVFNPESRRIYRYIQQNGELSTPANWLTSPLGFQAEDVYGIAVDGDLWLTTKTGELHKFTSGRATSFTISELTEPLSGPVSVVNNPEQTYLYLFVPNQGRVVVLSKDGVFVRQIRSSALAGATAVAVDEEQNQLYIVSGSVVYQVAILQQE